jgi:peroxiredoxin
MKLKKGWVTWASRVARWLRTLLLAGLIFWGTSTWQARELVPEEEFAPQFRLFARDGQRYSLSDAKGKTLLLYFFAPWCTICHFSIGNLEGLQSKQEEGELLIWLVALSYQSLEEVDVFLHRHQLPFPVLFGDKAMAVNYRIRAFPT